MRTVLSILVLLLFAAPVAAQGLLACGGHVVTGSGAPRALLDFPPGSYARPTEPRPAWMTARDRELWDALVYDAYDSGHFVGSTPDLEDRRTTVTSRRTVPGILVCIEPSDASYTGERLAPYANERWWRDQNRALDRIALARKPRGGRGLPDSTVQYVIVVSEGDPEEIGEKTLAITYSRRNFGSWSSSRIEWNPDNLRRAEDFQVEVALAHELGHALGLWHTPDGTGFIMDAKVPRTRPTWPEKENDLANLAYEVGPNVDYPGLTGAMPVPALPLVGVLLLAVLVMASALGERKIRLILLTGDHKRLKMSSKSL